MAMQHRTYLDAPSTGFLRTVVILCAFHAGVSALAFLSSLIGALFLDYYDNPLRAIIFTLIPLIEATAMIILIVFFRRDHVRKNTILFTYPVALYALINLLFVIHAHSNWKWDSFVSVISFILLALVAADCYCGYKRIAISMIALIFTGSCHLISIIYALIITTTASPDQAKLSVVAVSFLISLFSTIPYLIMILSLRCVAADCLVN